MSGPFPENPRLESSADEARTTRAEREIHNPSSVIRADDSAVNASGHKDQLQRQYSLVSICGLALSIDNAWVALGGSLVVAIANGGPPGVLYELLVACSYYGFIGASIAELTSSIPSAGGVYHWASITGGPKYGRALGFFTGWLNFFGWIFGYTSIVAIASNVIVQIYAVFHPELIIHERYIFIAFIIINWSCGVIIIFANRWLPYLQTFGLFMVVVGGIVTIIVVAAKPERHASNAFVWSEWSNVTGWPSGAAFLTGVLNGAFTIGTPDAVTHMAEELPDPKRDMPKAIFAQIGLGTITAFCYAITLFYAINDLNSVVGSAGAFPLAAVYSQAIGNSGGTFGLLFIVLLTVLTSVIGTCLTVTRVWWTLARDLATPFPRFFAYVDERLSCPIPATVFCIIVSTGFGAIMLGSTTAFTDLAGSFVILTTTSYALVIGSHLLSRRQNMPKGPFWMGEVGFIVNGAAVILIVFFNIIFCLPYALPVTVQSMNYNSVILCGIVSLAGCWWFAVAVRRYPKPKVTSLYPEGRVVGASGNRI